MRFNIKHDSFIGFDVKSPRKGLRIDLNAIQTI